MPSNKRQTTVRLSDEGQAVLEAIQRRHGLTVTTAIEYALRATARAENIQVTQEQAKRQSP